MNILNKLYLFIIKYFYEKKVFIEKELIILGKFPYFKLPKIGRNCQIASSTLISDTDFHPIDSKTRKAQVEGRPFSFDMVKKEEIKIGDNVWIGWNSTILKGVQIGENSVVAAGSVVLKGIYPNNSLIAGNPAKVVKVLD